MKSWNLVISAFVIVGLALAYWLISPLWRVTHISEALPEVIAVLDQNGVLSNEKGQASSEKSAVVYSGSFTGFDKIHTGSGVVNIIEIGGKQYVRFEENFQVNNGPDLFVGFGKDGTYVKGSEVGALKGTIGSQNYELPSGFDASAYNEVWVWCRAFSVPFARAVLVAQ
jgi:hypothetical protein